MKTTIIPITLAIVLIVGASIITKGNSQTQTQTQNKTDTQVAFSNVSIVDGKQIITISAKGGYQPRKSIAKADMPTIIRFDTRGTFDCSSSVRIPSMNISKVLPQTGLTDIDIGIQQVATLQGTCGMGMYPFEVEFKS